jgi:hypothetical protein
VCRVDDGFCLVCLTTFSGELKEIPASTDPHVVACMFKQYFRELPSPIFPSGLYQAFLVCDQQIPNRFFSSPFLSLEKSHPHVSYTKMEALQKLTKRLPKSNRWVLFKSFQVIPFVICSIPRIVTETYFHGSHDIFSDFLSSSDDFEVHYLRQYNPNDTRQHGDCLLPKPLHSPAQPPTRPIHSGYSPLTLPHEAVSGGMFDETSSGVRSVSDARRLGV